MKRSLTPHQNSYTLFYTKSSGSQPMVKDIVTPCLLLVYLSYANNFRNAENKNARWRATGHIE
ncbi:MAG: hypothetical protein GW805_14130 [Ignavibacteria bacterium]|nr:hypothetical protein [Ignavibacteria bacterium]NCS82714.1 hypothetical protein [Ignavibacteria bacterium]OIO22867.1 MAG: hypothetical protein AUJ54_02870 [Ignavibacteria bacterium CG1_02_37_35]